MGSMSDKHIRFLTDRHTDKRYDNRQNPVPPGKAFREEALTSPGKRLPPDASSTGPYSLDATPAFPAESPRAAPTGRVLAAGCLIHGNVFPQGFPLRERVLAFVSYAFES